MTAKNLGIKLNLAESTISGYENETRKPDLETLNKIATIFEVSVDYLTGQTEIREPNLAHRLIDVENKAKGTHGVIEELTDSETNIGRAFFGGADQYTEEEIEVARAAAKAAIEAMRKARKRTE